MFSVKNWSILLLGLHSPLFTILNVYVLFSSPVGENCKAVRTCVSVLVKIVKLLELEPTEFQIIVELKQRTLFVRLLFSILLFCLDHVCIYEHDTESLMTSVDTCYCQ
jgi:hypothetical protein